MPFCSHCGNRVGAADLYCGACGTRQPSSFPRPPFAPNPFAGAPAPADPLANISPRTFSILCYIPLVGWVASVVVLGATRFRNDLTLRFHAFQGLYLFAAWLLVNWAIEPIFNAIPHLFRLDHMLEALLLAVWIFMIVKTSHGETYSLPLVGELAHRSVHER